MSHQRNYWDNAPTERFFSSLKREWLTGSVSPTWQEAVADVSAYLVYYHSRRLHTMLGDRTPIKFEQRVWVDLTTTLLLEAALLPPLLP